MAFITHAYHLPLQIIDHLTVRFHDTGGGITGGLFNRFNLTAGNIFGFFNGSIYRVRIAAVFFPQGFDALPGGFKLFIDFGNTISRIGCEFINCLIQLFTLTAQKLGAAITRYLFLRDLQLFLLRFKGLRFRPCLADEFFNLRPQISNAAFLPLNHSA